MSRGNPILRIRIAPEARARWQKAADKASVSLSAWVRLAAEGVLARDSLRARAPKRRRAEQ
jgi:hypothetical protein